MTPMTSPSASTLPDALVSAICTQVREDHPELGDRITPEIVRSILSKATSAMEVTGGEPQKTIRRNTETGAVATRVTRDGIPMWEIVSGGTISYDMRPTLDDWALIYSPGVPQ